MQSKWTCLNTKELSKILRTQQLKRWWVAEYTGIHKTTFRRWLDKDIQKVRIERARALARVLEVNLERIVRPA